MSRDSEIVATVPPRAEMTSALGGFLRRGTSAAGLLTCQARRSGGRCDRVLGAVRGRAVPTGRVMPDVRNVGESRVALWCPRCRMASEFNVE